ncbi:MULTISPECIES: helix-turn-helix domain-containing protein [unclassified Flavonifractor]|uniref:helix-turn-helix domain-containing protein n=1 Tax=unclassified Flavonifractor TaxID=2629267 RepID=UPI0013022E75|nr:MULTISPECIES: helix-turn-helix domain-containing protein [unclassified Flavonifractor]
MKYLTLKDRRLIAKLYRQEARVLDIANKVGCHPGTIYEELRRGATGKLDENQRPEYDPDLAQKEVRASIRRRGNHRKAPMPNTKEED